MILDWFFRTKRYKHSGVSKNSTSWTLFEFEILRLRAQLLPEEEPTEEEKKEIEEARKEITEGKYVTLEDVMKELG